MEKFLNDTAWLVNKYIQDRKKAISLRSAPAPPEIEDEYRAHYNRHVREVWIIVEERGITSCFRCPTALRTCTCTTRP